MEIEGWVKVSGKHYEKQNNQFKITAYLKTIENQGSAAAHKPKI